MPDNIYLDLWGVRHRWVTDFTHIDNGYWLWDPDPGAMLGSRSRPILLYEPGPEWSAAHEAGHYVVDMRSYNLEHPRGREWVPVHDDRGRPIRFGDPVFPDVTLPSSDEWNDVLGSPPSLESVLTGDSCESVLTGDSCSGIRSGISRTPIPEQGPPTPNLELPEVARTLDLALKLLLRYGWHRGPSMARNENNDDELITAENICSYSLEGSIYRAAYIEDPVRWSRKGRGAVDWVIREMLDSKGLPAGWLESRQRKLHHIERLLRRAIHKATLSAENISESA